MLMLIQLSGDSAVQGRSTSHSGTIQLEIFSLISSSTISAVSAVLGNAQLLKVDKVPTNSKGRAHWDPGLSLNNACTTMTLSHVVPRSRRFILCVTDSLAYFVVKGTNSGNWYAKVREDLIDYFITWTKDGYSLDIIQKMEWPHMSEVIRSNLYASQYYDWLVTWVFPQSNQATYWEAIVSYLVSPLRTQDHSELYRFPLIESGLDKSMWDGYWTISDIQGCQVVTFVAINKTVIMEWTNKQIIHFQTHPLNLRLIAIVSVRQE